MVVTFCYYKKILLTSDDSSYMNGIDENLTFLFVPSKLPDSNEGHPFGGLAIMRRQSLNILVQCPYRKDL